MTATATSRRAAASPRPTGPRWGRVVAIGVGVCVVLMVVAMVVPLWTGWEVHAQGLAPLHARGEPRLGPGTPAAILLGVAAIVWAPRVQRWPWHRLLLVVFGFGVAWMVSLAAVDGVAGLGAVLERQGEYLGPAREITDVGALLREYIARIPLHSDGAWPTHLAGHPPGAVLFFVLLVRLGLGSALAAGLVVIVLAATTAVAVMITVRRLASEQLARQAAPFLVAGPAAIWMAVSADAVFAAVAAWGACALAVAATSRSAAGRIAWGAAPGLLFGWCVMSSYGLPLLGVLAVTILVLARSALPLAGAIPAALAVVGGFALGGFAWWEAYPVLVQRYWDGIASARPGGYWIWGDLAALTFSAGPWLGASVGTAGATLVDAVRGWPSAGRRRGTSVDRVSDDARSRRPSARHRPRSDAGRQQQHQAAPAGTGHTRRGVASLPATDAATRARIVVAALTAAAVAMVLLADLSQMSRAEVERIWLPFVPWLLVASALLPARWRRVGLGVQVVFALLVQHLIWSQW
ncbi:hypothetical protein [Microbacterium luticocti]|uniref:hypothetical protein n=1 Tax=Microbacterium luticocti TaxID=451764 RepID=UPI0003F92D42|nr:hypothetical protein [Microbacterium luticocti]